MATLKFKIDTSKAQSQIQQMYQRLKAEQIPAACAAAINRTLTEGRTSIVRALSRELTLKVGSIREVVNIRKVDKTAVAAGKSGHITLNDKLRPLYDYPHRAGKRGITVRVRKGKTPEKYRHRFEATVGKGGHIGIFERAKGRDKGGKLTKRGYARRLPIREVYGPSVTAVFANAGTIAEQEVSNLGETLAKNVKSQIARFTKPKKKA